MINPAGVQDISCLYKKEWEIADIWRVAGAQKLSIFDFSKLSELSC